MKFRLEKTTSYPIVAHIGIAVGDTAEGRIIPALVIDVANNKEIEDLVMAHKEIVTGDVQMSWGYNPLKKDLLLFKMEFSKPMEIEFTIHFYLPTQYNLIDGMVQAKGVYIQTGKIEDSTRKRESDPRILIEVPPLEMKKKWKQLLLSILKKKYKKLGLSKGDSLDCAKTEIGELKKLWKIRIDKNSI